MPRVGLVQLCSSDNPRVNLEITESLIAQAANDGAEIVMTPEVTNMVSLNRADQIAELSEEADDITLAALCAQARDLEIWILIGSLALKTDDPDGRFANRSFLISPDGAVMARYDKLHMFDVTLSDGEGYFESRGYRAGTEAVLANTPLGKIGMTICYDLRFPGLFGDLARAGAQIITIPSAFTVPTGKAHFLPLLQARAIETGCYICAPCQSGEHPSRGKSRQTYGHSMVISPWGDVMLDMGTEVGAAVVELDLAAVDKARQKIPSLTTASPYKLRYYE